MPIQRPLDTFTRMGPGDVLLAGHIERPDLGTLAVTPRECAVEYASPAPGDFRYSVTLPGKGSLDIAGVCTAFQPTVPNDDFRQIVHSYNRDTRTIEFTIYEQPGPPPPPPAPPAPPQEVQIQVGQRLYFWVHLYDSAPQRPNLVIEAP